MLKRLLCFMLCLLLPAVALCEKELVITEPEPFTAYPELTADGYLADAAGEFVHVDKEAGVWIYLSGSLRVEIRRYRTVIEYQPVYWYESEIWSKDGTVLRAFLADSEHPKKGHTRPENIAKHRSVVYAQNGDLFTWRIEQKRKTGIIIRGGQVVSNQPYKKAVTAIPALDELSLYADGHIEVHLPGELSSEDYLAKGALDVLSFGPILVRDGVMDERVKNNFDAMEPRSAIGMVSPCHYVGVMVEGRNKRSNGAPLSFLAQRLMARGCTQGFNLDGGQTAAMIFMGDIIMETGLYNGYSNTRAQQDIIGIGQSALVPSYP